MHQIIRLLIAAAAVSAAALSLAQDDGQRRRPPTGPQTPKPPIATPGPTAPPGGYTPSLHKPPKPYADVITKDATTQIGLFKVHQLHDQVLFEIPKALLDRDLLMSVQVVRTPPGLGGLLAAGMPAAQAVIRFDKRNDTLLMRIPQYSVRAKHDKGLEYGLGRASVAPIVNAFDVLAYAPDGAAVIDVTRLYNTDPGDFSVGPMLGGSGVDPTRSFIELVRAFPQNIEVESQLTFHATGGGLGFRGGGGGGGSRTTKTAYVHYSLLLLPEQPMQPRLKDSRIGYFSTYFTQYDGAKLASERVGYIDRFRLEKKDPKSLVSEPVKPIVFYIQRDVPSKWRPYLHQAVEAWQPAFLAAGFKNAIVAKDEPTRAEDPDFHAGDLRYNLISWSPSTTENAEGLHIADPRTGETLHAHVFIWNDVLKLAQDWYFVQASPNNPAAQKLPLPDSLIGRIMRYVVTHEVGHCLGLEHNFKASSAYTVAQLRSPAFTKKYGDEASIMDYGRFNYVAQPGDNAHLIPIVGPYDFFAIKYGYMPALAPTPEAEKPYLDDYLAQQVTNPMLRFGNSDSSDPGMETEDIGSDPVQASTYGLKNLDRVLGYLMSACDKFGDDYSRLQAMYRQVLNQRMTELNHVAKLVGGVYDTDYHAGRGGAVYTVVPKAQQAKAVHFLVTKGLTLGPGYYHRSILDRVESSGYIGLADASQTMVLMTLFAESRVDRMLDNEAENGTNAYTVRDLVSDVQGSVWSELHNAHPLIPLQRRTLQLGYLELLDGRLNGAGASKSEFRTIARADLKQLRAGIVRGIPRTRDLATRSHLEACRDRIKDILDGKTPPSGGGFPNLGFLFGIDQPSFCEFDDAPPMFEGVPRPHAVAPSGGR
ncbi:MAG: zinc-dependent metalloprotease [Fimbriimonadaceae bacterium]